MNTKKYINLAKRGLRPLGHKLIGVVVSASKDRTKHSYIGLDTSEVVQNVDDVHAMFLSLEKDIWKTDRWKVLYYLRTLSHD